MFKKFGISLVLTLITLCLVLPTRALSDDDDEYEHHDRGRHRGWYKHEREQNALQCDEDGDYCVPNPRGSYYSSPYGYTSAQASLVAQRNNLLYKTQGAQADYYAALQRGDRNGAKHFLNAIRGDQRALSSINTQLGISANAGIGSTEPYYNPYSAPPPAYNYNPNPAPAYNPYAAPGYNPYPQNQAPAADALGNIMRQFMGQ
jgi:hypothetical protein